MRANNDNAMLRAALSYAEQGFKVFPLKPGGKKPITQHGLKDASQLQVTVQEYWRKNPNANIGLSCDGLLVLDLDGKVGAESKIWRVSANMGNQNWWRYSI